MSIKLVTRTKAALFFTFLFPIIFLFVYSGIFARGNPEAVVYMFGPVVTLNIMGERVLGAGIAIGDAARAWHPAPLSSGAHWPGIDGIQQSAGKLSA